MQSQQVTFHVGSVARVTFMQACFYFNFHCGKSKMQMSYRVSVFDVVEINPSWFFCL